MPEVNILAGYPKPTKPRFVGRNMRTINHRLTAVERGENFFDGDRNFGYGTKAHFDGLKKYGVTSHHRKGFKPIHKILSN